MMAFLVDFNNHDHPLGYYGNVDDAARLQKKPELQGYALLPDSGQSKNVKLARSILKLNSDIEIYDEVQKAVRPRTQQEMDDVKDAKINRKLAVEPRFRALMEELEILHPGITQNVRSRLQQLL